MEVGLEALLSDRHLEATQTSQQRQLSMSISAIAPETGVQNLRLNLCLILDRSGSMAGQPLKTVKQAAIKVIERLQEGDHLSVIAFNHHAEVLIANQEIDDRKPLTKLIERLEADGGTSIDEGMRLGIEEIAKGKQDAVSQVFLLTDGENEHGDNDRCLKLANLATEYKLTINTLGFGAHWNQDILEKLADAGGGTLSYIEHPEEAISAFSRLFDRVQSVGLTNAFLKLSFNPAVRLAELKPVAQVSPDTIELSVQTEADGVRVRLGDLMKDQPRVVLANLYIGQVSIGEQAIATVQVIYDNPSLGAEGLESSPVEVTATVTEEYQPRTDPQVQSHMLTLAKYRQTQIAETKLKAGDRQGAATLLQTAAKTALQMGDRNAATILQESATRLQAGDELSEQERKKTRIASKTRLG
ncbi:VWA domain-containing protein [Roseofilum sp. BLCC_M154]|uniref:VWA domain-containing protein n=1 Tax=Roseofilum acuticapitatum BLCC-M154 TaxID=3022444 RepID=A0ABT7AMG1_9CYAN|nr:VWA domain-containing protein [Roseofilum acuticapitatum]MDJ1168071.1 VWA domain-containing protein [Roseofilum acuticapitatum BLCC-M154]